MLGRANATSATGLTVIEASAVLKRNLNVGPTAKSEHRPNQVNNKSRHADDKEIGQLRHGTLSLTCDTQLILDTHGDPS